MKVLLILILLFTSCKGYEVKVQDHTVYPNKTKK